MAGISFEELILDRCVGPETRLKCLSEDGKTESEYWIKPKKLSHEIAGVVTRIYAEMARSHGIEPDPNRSDTETQKLIEARYKAGKIEGTGKHMSNLWEAYFIHGVSSHNLTRKNKENPEEAGPLYVFDKKTFEEFLRTNIILKEIFQIGSDWNAKLNKLLEKDEATAERKQDLEKKKAEIEKELEEIEEAQKKKRELLYAVRWTFDDVEFATDAVLPDCMRPREVLRQWRPWIASAIDRMDGDGCWTCWHYQGAYADQPHFDLGIFGIIRMEWNRLNNKKMKEQMDQARKGLPSAPGRL